MEQEGFSIKKNFSLKIFLYVMITLILLGIIIFNFSLLKDNTISLWNILISNDSTVNNYLKYFLLYGFIIITTIVFFLYLNDNSLFSSNANVSGKTILYLFGITIPLIVLLMFVLPNLRQGTSNKEFLMYGIAIFIFIMGISYIYTLLSKEQLIYISYIFSLLTLLITITGLSIFFYIFTNYLKTFTGWSGFFVYLIFYIPCLLIDFINYIKSEIKLTTNTVYILFILEILLILAYLYLPKLYNKFLNRGSRQLLAGSKFLDTEYMIAKAKDLRISREITGLEEKTLIFDENFALSMWIYVNIQQDKKKEKEINIFDYGNGKPNIVYLTDSETNEYKIYLTNQNDQTKKNYFIIKLTPQNWNNIVFNYTSNGVDLFINGKIERTLTYDNNNVLPQYYLTDVIKIGGNKGLNGAISNVKYYKKPLTQFEIANNYNLLMYKNPPTSNNE